MFSDLTHYIFQPPVPWRHRTALVYHLRWTTGRILLSLVIPSSTNSSWVFSQRSFSSKAAGRATPLGAAAAGGGRRRRKKAGPRDVGRREAPPSSSGRGPVFRKGPAQRGGSRSGRFRSPHTRDGQSPEAGREEVCSGRGDAGREPRRTGRTLRIRPPTPRAAQTAQRTAATRPPAAPSPVPGGQASEAASPLGEALRGNAPPP